MYLIDPHAMLLAGIPLPRLAYVIFLLCITPVPPQVRTLAFDKLRQGFADTLQSITNKRLESPFSASRQPALHQPSILLAGYSIAMKHDADPIPES